MVSAAQQLKNYLSSQKNCHSTTMMARHGDAVIGVHIGTEVVMSSANLVFESFMEAIKGGSILSRLATEVCRPDTPSTWTIGIYADFRGNIAATQDVLRSWAEAKCLSGSDSKDALGETEISFVRATSVPAESKLFSGFEQVGEPVKRSVAPRSNLVPRAECRAIQVDEGDGCWSLSQRCGISQTQFESFNPNRNICNNTLKAKQWVCCSKGDLPDSKYPLASLTRLPEKVHAESNFDVYFAACRA
jgi:hypothetical protein